jgi:hypothetical protein
LSAQLFAVTKYFPQLRSYRATSTSPPTLRLQYKVEALKDVRAATETLDGIPSDGLVLALILLSSNGDPVEGVFQSSHPLSPLATTQNLHLFSNATVCYEHQQALRYVIGLKGGASHIRAVGLADGAVL